MARKKKQQGSNVIGLVILGALGLGIYQFGIADSPHRSGGAAPRPAAAVATSASPSSPSSPTRGTPAPLDAPRYVNVAELNVRHTPSMSAPLVMTLPRGTPLKVLGRKDGWLLIDINPTLEGWVSEQLTTTKAPQTPRPPEALRAAR